jgi:hypothetical protein
MNYRELGSTGIVVSDIGFGAWGIGGESAGATSYGKTKDSESKKSIDYLSKVEDKLKKSSFGHEEAKKLLLQIIGKWI